MADTVRYLMEEMIPELEDMVKQKYFSKQEVKQIVKRRQDFEYMLKRKATLKEDFLRYIEYESKLDALRQHRRQALGLEGKKKKSLADFAIVRRIHFIFERAVRKFKTDLSLWTAWLEFCRSSSSNRRLGRVVARALQIHPTEPGLWVYAAAWEFEHNANPAAARALMQQGLRMCRHSEKMWLDYFDLELMYVEKLVARRRILGLEVPDPDVDEQQQQEQDHVEGPPAAGRKRRRGAAGRSTQDDQEEQRMGDAAGTGDGSPDDEDGEGPENDTEAAAAAAAGGPTLTQVLADQKQQQDQQQQDTGLQEAQAAVKAVLTGAVAKLVYQQALKATAAAASKGAVSSSNYLKLQPCSSGSSSSSSSSSGLEFRAGFLRVLGRYTSPGVLQLKREVVASIRQDYAADPAAADLLARIACDPADIAAPAEAVQSAVHEFERLLGGTTSTPAAADSHGSTKGRSAKRLKKAAAPGDPAGTGQQRDAAAATPEAARQVYHLYCAYLQEHMQALLAHEEHALSAAAVAQQLFKVLLAAHTAGAADEGLYEQWVQLARQLQQSKVALKAARLATQAHASSATAWQTRLDLEAEALGCNMEAVAAAAAAAAASSPSSGDASQQQQQLFVLVVQALQQVPAASAVQLWQQGFNLAEALTGAGGSSQHLTALQQLLLKAVTSASVKGPCRGGLGAAAASCLGATWRVLGAAAARKLWQQLLLLPPAGGDMFRSMVALESQPAGSGGSDQVQQDKPDQAAQQLTRDAVRQVRAVYEAWASAYGSTDAALWVQWALFEQQQGKAGAGKVYWRAVKALHEPEDFIAEYRQRVGLV